MDVVWVLLQELLDTLKQAVQRESKNSSVRLYCFLSSVYPPAMVWFAGEEKDKTL